MAGLPDMQELSLLRAQSAKQIAGLSHCLREHGWGFDYEHDSLQATQKTPLC